MRCVFYIEDQPVNLGEVIYNLYEAFQHHIANKDQIIHFHQLNHPAYVRGMVEYIRQAIGSIISNAIQYTEDRGEIVMSIEETLYATIVIV